MITKPLFNHHRSHLLFLRRHRAFINLFSSTSPPTDFLHEAETKIRALCEKPTSQFIDAFSIFNQIIDSNLIPSGSTSNFLVGALTKGKRYNLSLQVELAIGVLGLMVKRGFSINIYNVNLVLKGLCRNGEVDKAMELFRVLDRDCVLFDIVSFNTVINGLCKAKRLEEAMGLRAEMEAADCSPDTVTYGTLMDGLCKEGRVDEAMDLMEEIRLNGLEADVFVYGALISGFCHQGDVIRGKEIFDEMLGKGISPNVVTYTCLIHGLGKMGQWKEATEGKNPDVATYNSLLRGLCENGKVDEAMMFFDKMLKENYIELDDKLFSVLIQGLCKEGRFDEALEFLSKMVDKGSVRDMMPYNILIGACLEAGHVEKAMGLWKQALQLGLVPNSSFTYSATINGFCKLHMVNIAKGILIKMRASGLTPTLLDYNTLIATLCKDGSLEQARRLFYEMRNANCDPDVISFNTLLDGTLKAGDVQSAKQFSKLGQLDDAKSVFEAMIASGFTPDVYVYDSLLKGFYSRGEKEEIINLLHKIAAKGVHLDSEITSTILMCICYLSEDINIMELLPSFSQQTSKGSSITFNELLTTLQKSHSGLQLSAA
ncbi:tetratricopeptide repeat (TPR)-like superfamily protein [Actinidia rufa]|uniref:Tetratricopeptide repeat (TPR)-like superfamily protein n=1 Tax=Actinidia rufa TaxID=165716 RepID=A0A7J0HD34_9ERIC|nr:tetratricopeptide repeat (TPR)-like superfamily protein [Actinidia rufa]